MELFTGRVSADAKVTTLKDERRVVNFSLAINDFYKSKQNEQGVKVVTYINCSYWISTKIAEHLVKGAVVEIIGRLYVSAYKNMEGEAKSSLNCHVNQIKIHHTPKNTVSVKAETVAEKSEDLPF